MTPTAPPNWTISDLEERLREAILVLRGDRQPTVTALQRASEVSIWLDWLTPEDARLVRMRAERAPWKQVCREFGISRATAHRRLKYVLSVIAWRLNGRPIPSTWSHRYLVERARILSSSS